jgi:hypothetical protein
MSQESLMSNYHNKKKKKIECLFFKINFFTTLNGFLTHAYLELTFDDVDG